MKKTLKEIYNYEFIEKPETSLLKDINVLLNKNIDELNVHDICVLIRQEMFIDISVPKAIEMIKNDHSVGDYYDYSLLVNLSNMQTSLTKYKEQITSLIEILEKDFNTIKFDLDSDKTDYVNSVDNLIKKIIK